MQKAFVILRLQGFSRNLRSEIVKNPRFYFYDIGIRNALINNFNPISMRDNVGMLWENYIILERLKKQEHMGISANNNYFWRTYTKKEINFIEGRSGKLYGYEIKWFATRVKPPKIWLETYKGANFDAITKDNYLGFIT